MSEPTPPPAAAPAASEKKAKKPLVLMLAGVLVLAGGGGGGFWYMRRTPAVVVEKVPERGIVAFEPFVVNLADANASHFLRTTVQLVVNSEADAEHLKKTPVVLMRARGAILELLTVQTADALVTPGGKAELKKAIAERVGEALEHVKVVDVLFSDFVVQF